MKHDGPCHTRKTEGFMGGALRLFDSPKSSFRVPAPCLLEGKLSKRASTFIRLHDHERIAQRFFQSTDIDA
ncbi:MAG: hypothetical protein KIT40_12170 [Nitrospira sp.]|nr:hypothetical protein [Nitrospira sp.]